MAVPKPGNPGFGYDPIRHYYIKDDDGVGGLIFLEHCHTQMSSLEIFLIKVYVVQ